MRWPRVRFTVRMMMAAVALAALLLGGIVADLARRRAERTHDDELQCTNSLMNVAYGLQTYQELHGRYPPPFTADADGRRMHSWRILALPFFMIDAAPARAYDYSDSWDAAGNAGLSARVPYSLLCPAELHRNPRGSSFVMPRDLSALDPASLPSNAVLVVEAWGANRDWLDPNDAVATSAVLRMEASGHPHGFGVVLRDRTVKRLSDARRIRDAGRYYILEE